MTTRILTADDHKRTREAIAEIVRQSGEDWTLCGEAEDGRAAVAMALERNPDLVILDIRMPNMDGMAAGRLIRARFPDVPILIYSLMATPALDAAAQAAGFQGVVAKSDAIGLAAAIRKLVSSGHSGEPEPRPSGKAAPANPEARSLLGSSEKNPELA